MSSITDLYDYYLKTYEDFIVINDFDRSESSSILDSFLDKRKCEIIMKNEICFKSVKGLCMDLLLTSTSSLHTFTNLFETGISDHHLSI